MNQRGLGNKYMVKTLIIFIGLMISLTGVETINMVIEYKKITDEDWKKNLPSEVYHICRQKGTEASGLGEYDHFYEKGTYYCACCGEDYPLFSSQAKFDSGTGWPSFWEPISPQNVTLKEDRGGLFGWAIPRTEVVCSRCGGHLGHVFDDGPKDHGGLRYCMNSLALKFVQDGQKPKNNLKIAQE